MSKHTNKKKRNHQRTRLKKSPLQLINILILLISVILLAIIVNTFIDNSTQENNDLTKNPEITTKEIIKKPQVLQNNYEEKKKALNIEYENANNFVIKKKKEHTDYTFFYDDNETIEPILLEENNEVETITIKNHPIEIEKQTDKTTLPKLAIIIDDVVSSSQIKKIQNIGFPVTMAFLPPTKGHKNSAKITKDLDFYMVHLPLEAGSHKYEEENTLRIGVSLEDIEKRIIQIKKWYPNSNYVNNHTGSKFTSDYNSMDKLFTVLKKYNYIFLDSKTTPNSVVKKVAKKHGVKYITRNIFLDNIQENKYITKQLQKAIHIAKKTGYAIAIGHPHNTTIETLKNSKELLDGLELVLVHQL
jgi:polysaccharide deacetylase 2 family uncharacterized protein YibQ